MKFDLVTSVRFVNLNGSHFRNVSFCTKKQLKDRKVDKPATFFLFSILLLTMADAFEQPGRKESS